MQLEYRGMQLEYRGCSQNIVGILGICWSIFNYFLIRILIRKRNHQNQDIAKSWKNQFFNYFLIRILIRKSNHQNQDIAKS